MLSSASTHPPLNMYLSTLLLHVFCLQVFKGLVVLCFMYLGNFFKLLHNMVDQLGLNSNIITATF